MHSDILHSPASEDSPEHWSSPPKSAPLQALARSLDPLPQDTLHWDHWPQSCHSAAIAAVILKLRNFQKKKDCWNIMSNMNGNTWTLRCLAMFSLRGIPRTLFFTSNGWLVTSSSSYFGPKTTRGCALGPLAPFLPLSNCGCNIITLSCPLNARFVNVKK